MRMRSGLQSALASIAILTTVPALVAPQAGAQQQQRPQSSTPPPGFFPVPLPPQAAPQQPATQLTPAKPNPAPGTQSPATANPAKPNPATPTPATAGNPQATTPEPAAPSGAPTVYGGLSLNNASLTEVIDLLARQLKINYVLDPRVKGNVVLSTYGETKDIDTRSLLETILRINGFGMVKQGDLYRIVPLSIISHLPLPIEKTIDAGQIPEDDRTMLNLIFLKYVTADELEKILNPFLGENAVAYTYAPANIIFLLDSRRNMRRLMDLVSLFDSDSLANKRVHLFETVNGQPSDLVKELDAIVKSIALNEKNAPIKFIPVNRINTIIAIAPNPGAFTEVEKWIKKLDVPAKITAGAVDNYVYRVKYGQAPLLAGAIMTLYGVPNAFGGMGMGGGYGGGFGGGGFGGGGFGGGGFGGGGFGGGGFGGGGFGGGGYGGGGYGGGGYGGGGYGGGGYGGGGYGGGGYGGGGYGGGGYAGGGFAPPVYSQPVTQTPAATGTAGSIVAPVGGTTDLTGSYLGNANQVGGLPPGVPRIIPNPLDNSLLIQATPQNYAAIMKLLHQLDVAPRQVLLEAKIYEVTLTGAFASGVSAFLQQR